MRVQVSLSDAYLPFDARDAARSLKEHAWQLPALAKAHRDALRPIDGDDLRKRLTALGMTLAPSRPSAEATMWLHETARLLSDLPKDILWHAVDECQRRLRFLPTVAEIREIADPLLAERKTNADRLEAIVVALNTPDQPAEEPQARRLCTPEQAEEALRETGLLAQVRGDTAKPVQLGPLRKPTRQDYIEMGVDPAVLDSIEIDRDAA